MKCPQCKKDKNLTKAGLRNSRQGLIQKYYCKKCKKYFSDKDQAYTQYPLKVILYTLQNYNKGYPVKKIKTLTGKKYRYSPPTRTIYSWINKYKNTLTFIKLRKKYNIEPTTLTTTKRFYHKQIYPFTYHNLKLNLKTKELPQFKRYINWIKRSLPNKIFLSGPRASQTDIKKDVKIIKRKTNDIELTRLALKTKEKNVSAHELVEQFFLYNDKNTVCIELPVFINPEETHLFKIDTPLTGHIDLIQIRNNELHILDYKPNLNHPEKYKGQLLAYKEAVHHRTQIPEKNIVTAVFNQYDYYEFK